MTKQEKAVLQACNARFDAFMSDGDFANDAAVVKNHRGRKHTSSKLIRAVARWRKATGKSKE